MKNVIVFFILILTSSLYAQSSEITENLSLSTVSDYEIKLMLGLSSYEGDLHCFEDDELGLFTNSKFAFGLGVTKNLTSNLGLGISYRNTKLSGDDKKFSADSGHQKRGFTFDNSIHELTIRADYMMLGHKDLKIQPYLYVGAGFAFGGADTDYNPSGIDNTNLDSRIMQDINDRKKSSFALPIGIGFKGNLSDKITLGIEGGLRFFTNDYLDGVSMSGNSGVNDFYGMGGVTIAYKLYL